MFKEETVKDFEKMDVVKYLKKCDYEFDYIQISDWIDKYRAGTPAQREWILEALEIAEYSIERRLLIEEDYEALEAYIIQSYGITNLDEYDNESIEEYTVKYTELSSITPRK